MSTHTDWTAVVDLRAYCELAHPDVAFSVAYALGQGRHRDVPRLLLAPVAARLALALLTLTTRPDA